MRKKVGESNGTLLGRKDYNFPVQSMPGGRKQLEEALPQVKRKKHGWGNGWVDCEKDKSLERKKSIHVKKLGKREKRKNEAPLKK